MDHVEKAVGDVEPVDLVERGPASLGGVGAGFDPVGVGIGEVVHEPPRIPDPTVAIAHGARDAAGEAGLAHAAAALLGALRAGGAARGPAGPPHPAGQAPLPRRRLATAPDQEHAVTAHDDGADADARVIRILAAHGEPLTPFPRARPRCRTSQRRAPRPAPSPRGSVHPDGASARAPPRTRARAPPRPPRTSAGGRARPPASSSWPGDRAWSERRRAGVARPPRGAPRRAGGSRCPGATVRCPPPSCPPSRSRSGRCVRSRTPASGPPPPARPPSLRPHPDREAPGP